jgi:hypothetical protein
MEVLGMILVSLGLGGIAGWWLGMPGMFLVTGALLLSFATLAAVRQKAMATPKQPNGSR